MINVFMARFLLKLYLFLIIPLASYAYDETPKCYRELVRNFFEPRLVTESFDLYRVFQSQWNKMLSDLKINAQAAPQRIKDRARAMHPNPFDHPFDPEKAKEIFLAVEFEIFREVMVYNYWYDIQAIYGMFNYIKDRQQAKIDACFVAPKRANNRHLR